MKARSISNKSIEHSISQKTELSKKNEKELTSKSEKTVRHADTEKLPVSRINPDNRPISEKKSGRSVSTAKIHVVSATESKAEIKQPISPTGNPPPNNSVPLKTQIHKVSESKSTATPIKVKAEKVIKSGTDKGIKTAAQGVCTAAAVMSKPVHIVKGQLVSQKARTDKTEDSGTEAIKLGLQSYGYAERGLKTAKDTVQSSVKTVKNIRRKLQKRTTADSKRHLQKKIKGKRQGSQAH